MCESKRANERASGCVSERVGERVRAWVGAWVEWMMNGRDGKGGLDEQRA